MPSTSRSYTAYAAHALFILAMSSTAYGDTLKPLVYKGCYSSSSGLSKNADYLYQTSGWCQPRCVNNNQAVVATSNGDECWCGNELPPSESKVDDDKCSTPCTGYGTENCGGNGYFSVYLDGLKENVGDASPSNTNSGTHTVTSASPSVITQVSPGKTVVETVHAESTSGADSSSGGGGGVNSTAVAAGVVVAVVVISAIIAGLFFWCRHRKRQVAEEEYKRTQVSDFIHGSKPPQTGYSSMSDSRLDPEFGNKRNSHGSIADNEDFSRKILRVANPDRSG